MAKKHKGPVATSEICILHRRENGARPSAKDGRARAEWDAGLFRRSPLISTSVANGVAVLNDDGMLVPAPRTK